MANQVSAEQVQQELWSVGPGESARSASSKADSRQAADSAHFDSAYFDLLRKEATRMVKANCVVVPIICKPQDANRYPQTRNGGPLLDKSGNPRPAFVGKNPSCWKADGEPMLLSHRKPPALQELLRQIDTAERLRKPLGIAIVPSPENTAIDFDAKDYAGGAAELAADVERLLSEHPELRATRRESTPSGGQHFYVSAADGMESWQKANGKGHHCHFSTTENGQHRGEVLVGTRVCVTWPTPGYILLSPEHAHTFAEVPNLAAIGITPCSGKSKAKPKPQQAAATPPPRMPSSGGKVPQLAELLGKMAQEVLSGGRPYGSNPESRSDQLAGFMNELYSVLNWLEADGLNFDGSPDALTAQAVAALEIEDKADRVIEGIKRAECQLREDRIESLLKRYSYQSGERGKTKPAITKLKDSDSDLIPLETPPEKPTKQELQQWLRQQHQLRFDELRQVVEIDGRLMEELDLADSFLADMYGIETTKQAARDSFVYLAHCQKFNPVRKYLEALPGTPGLRLLPLQEIAAAFGIAADDTLSQELLARHLAGGYRRGVEPGYKHDQVLLLQGEQGQRKGQTIAALAPPGMADSVTRVGKGLEDREFLGKLNSCWIFEFDEVEKVLQGRDASEFKGFASRSNYRYVQKWETLCRPHPARALLFASTNVKEVLNDHTGSRRIWVLPVGDCNPNWVVENQKSIWATVATWVAWGLETYIPEGHPTALAAARRAQGVQISDAWEGAVRTQLETDSATKEGIALDNLARQAIGIEEMERITRDVQMRLTRLVTGTGFTTHNGKVRWIQKKRRYDGGASRAGYVPVAVPTVPTCSDQSWGGWNGQKPWYNCDLVSLFQPFQPFKECCEEKEGSNGATVAPKAAACELQEMSKEVGTVGTPHQKPATTVDLPFQRVSEHVVAPGIGRNGGLFDLCETNTAETPIGSGTTDLQEGNQVELLQSDGSWRNGWRIAAVVNSNIGPRIRLESETDFRVVGPDRVRLCGQGAA
jgi:predicted P-loop ATPase